MDREKFIDYKCMVCGKNFVPAPEHVYKYKSRKVCSWGCMRKAEANRLR